MGEPIDEKAAKDAAIKSMANSAADWTDDDFARRFIKAAKAVVDAVSFDVNGILLPTGFHGGNGGLVSRETIAACDELRRAIAIAEVGRAALAQEGGGDGK